MMTKSETDRANKENETSNIFQTGRVVSISICHFIHDVYTSFLAPLLPLLIEKLSMSLAQAGFLTTIMQFPSLMNPFIGIIADRISVRYFVIFAPLLTAISMSFIGLAPSYSVLLIFLFVAGISTAIFHVPAPVLIARVSGTQVGKGMSFFMTGGEMARALGPMAAIGAVSVLGLEGFHSIVVFGFIASLWLYFKLRKVPDKVEFPQRKPLVQTFKETSAIFIPLSGILLTRGFMHASLTAFLPTFIEHETGNLFLSGIALTIFETSGVLGIMAAGSMSDRRGRRQVLMIFLVGAPISLLLFAFTTGWLRMATLLIIGFTVLSTTPVMLALVQEHAKDSPSAANGIFMMISFMARSAVVVLVGYIADHIGLQKTYIVCAGLGFFAIPFILMLPDSPPSNPTE